MEKMASFRSMALKIRNEQSNLTKVEGKPTSSSPEISANSNFMDVANHVVNSQRVARGFKQMWAKETPEADYFINGIHLEKKKLDLHQVAAEYKEVKRSQFYQELLVYIVFLLVFFTLIGWLPVQDGFEQSNVVRDLLCVDANSCEIENIEQVYDFAQHAQNRICNATESNLDNNRWIAIGGVMLRQVSVRATECEIAEMWNVECFPRYEPHLEDRDTMIGNEDRMYVWRNDMEVLKPWLHVRMPGSFSFLGGGGIESYGTGGYVLDLCNLKSAGIDHLREDNWIHIGTRAISLEFVLMNPSTQMFTIGIHVFTITPSGNLKHLPQGSNIRLVSNSEQSKFTGRRDTFAAFVLWSVALLFFFTYARAEYTEMTKMGITTYLRGDIWNIFELFQLLILGLVLFNIVVFYEQSQEAQKQLSAMHTEGQSRVNMLPLLITFQRLSDYASVASAISLLKVFKFLRMNSTLNLLWQVLGMAIKDLMGFLVIFNLIFLSYSYMGRLAFGFALEEFSTLQSSYATCFRMLAGDFDYQQLGKVNPRIAPVFFGTFVVLVFQILVNMFVAILSEYYEVVKEVSAEDEDVEYDVIRRFRAYLASCSPYVVLPDGEPLEIQKGQTIRLISTNLVDKEVTRQRAKKLFRGAVWRVVALLRFGVKFDRRITFGRRAPKDHVKSTSDRALHIPLSDNFDHKTIKVMLPKGITIRLEGDSLLGSDILLKVMRHSSLSIECKIIGSSYQGQAVEDVEAPIELIGGESLRIPWHFFALHVLRTIFIELRTGILRATKFWDPFGGQLVDDYHLGRLLTDAMEDGRNGLRFDELYRILDLYFRRDKRSQPITPPHVRRETASIMYRFRRSLIDMPSREKEGHDYRANPLDTSAIELGSLEYLSEMLAENCHDIWALERIKQGWTYGTERDCDLKSHPNLVPYHSLPKKEQAFDYRTSMETLKTILSLNFQIVRNTSAPSYLRNTQRSSSSVQSGKNKSGSGSRNNFSLRRLSSGEDQFMVEVDQDEVYYPRPIDTSDIILPPRLSQLADLLAENAHEVWSKGRMDEGWTYGSVREDKARHHPCLVPFIFLTDEEKEYDVNTAMGTLKMLIAMGFNVVDRESN